MGDPLVKPQLHILTNLPFSFSFPFFSWVRSQVFFLLLFFPSSFTGFGFLGFFFFFFFFFFHWVQWSRFLFFFFLSSFTGFGWFGFFFSPPFLLSLGLGFWVLGKKKATLSDRYGVHKQCEKYWVMASKRWCQTGVVF